MGLTLDGEDPVVTHGKASFLKQEKLAKMIREGRSVRRVASTVVFPFGPTTARPMWISYDFFRPQVYEKIPAQDRTTACPVRSYAVAMSSLEQVLAQNGLQLDRCDKNRKRVSSHTLSFFSFSL